ncbi:MAG: hypothetical protein BAJATHORv1_170010, partial [Candidatus Thorarchaeota archaeon]
MRQDPRERRGPRSAGRPPRDRRGRRDQGLLRPPRRRPRHTRRRREDPGRLPAEQHPAHAPGRHRRRYDAPPPAPYQPGRRCGRVGPGQPQLRGGDRARPLPRRPGPRGDPPGDPHDRDRRPARGRDARGRPRRGPGDDGVARHRAGRRRCQPGLHRRGAAHPGEHPAAGRHRRGAGGCPGRPFPRHLRGSHLQPRRVGAGRDAGPGQPAPGGRGDPPGREQHYRQPHPLPTPGRLHRLRRGDRAQDEAVDARGRDRRRRLRAEAPLGGSRTAPAGDPGCGRAVRPHRGPAPQAPGGVDRRCQLRSPGGRRHRGRPPGPAGRRAGLRPGLRCGGHCHGQRRRAGGGRSSPLIFGGRGLGPVVPALAGIPDPGQEDVEGAGAVGIRLAHQGVAPIRSGADRAGPVEALTADGPGPQNLPILICARHVDRVVGPADRLGAAGEEVSAVVRLYHVVAVVVEDRLADAADPLLVAVGIRLQQDGVERLLPLGRRVRVAGDDETAVARLADGVPPVVAQVTGEADRLGPDLVPLVVDAHQVDVPIRGVGARGADHDQVAIVGLDHRLPHLRPGIAEGAGPDLVPLGVGADQVEVVEAGAGGLGVPGDDQIPVPRLDHRPGHVDPRSAEGLGPELVPFAIGLHQVDVAGTGPRRGGVPRGRVTAVAGRGDREGDIPAPAAEALRPDDATLGIGLHQVEIGVPLAEGVGIAGDDEAPIVRGLDCVATLGRGAAQRRRPDDVVDGSGRGVGVERVVDVDLEVETLQGDPHRVAVGDRVVEPAFGQHDVPGDGGPGIGRHLEVLRQTGGLERLVHPAQGIEHQPLLIRCPDQVDHLLVVLYLAAPFPADGHQGQDVVLGHVVDLGDEHVDLERARAVLEGELAAGPDRFGDPGEGDVPPEELEVVEDQVRVRTVKVADQGQDADVLRGRGGDGGG